MDDDPRITNTIKLLQYAINRSIAIDPQLALDALEGRLTEADLGIPILEETRETDPLHPGALAGDGSADNPWRLGEDDGTHPTYPAPPCMIPLCGCLGEAHP